MSVTVIKVENLSKQYRLGEVGTGTLAHDLNRWWHGVRGKEDPYLKIGEENSRVSKGNSDYVWALKDINFEVKQGEVLGIIGKNGAGKSTLLKILSRTTSPTFGSVKIKGRVASLLEVGTGFHPELSGRDNIFLNGAILGMTKFEIRRKLDEIIDFAGVERYIDTPVKRFSSGMYVRLAFAVAAHLEPEILIVDEVLAVGDAEFQTKALGKMQQVSQGEGRTVLFVSHNLSSVNKLCNKALFMGNGRIVQVGPVSAILDSYSAYGQKKKGAITIEREPDKLKETKKLIITSLKIIDASGEVKNEYKNIDSFYAEIEFEVLMQGKGYNIGLELWNSRRDCLFTTKFWDVSPKLMGEYLWEKGKYTYRVKMPGEILKEGIYFLTTDATIPLKEGLDIFPGEVSFMLNDFNSPIFMSGEGRNGLVIPVLQWERQ